MGGDASSCTPLDPLAEPGCDCDPSGCFELSPGVGLCGVPAAEASTCSVNMPGVDAPPDECACDDKTCPTGLSCVQTAGFLMGAAPYVQNRCLGPFCSGHDDCTSGEYCMPGYDRRPVCGSVECLSDADCDAAPCGRCALRAMVGIQGQPLRDGHTVCVYGSLAP